MTVPGTDGFPYASQPTGWFQVAWSAEIGVGTVAPLHYFDRDLVVLRAESGAAQVLDAHCPHMGAHLGFGGTVRGEDVVCPFHGWSWSCSGVNTMVPSEGKATRRRRITSWPTHEANGIIWIWHDEAGRAPMWPGPADQPGVAEGSRYPVHPHCCRKFPSVRMRPQFVPENNVDLDHLHWVHGADGPIETQSYGPDGYCFRTSNRIIYGYGKKSTRLTPDGPVEVIVDAELWGVGYQYTFFPLPDQAISIQAQTPVDDRHCDMFQTVLVYREPGDEGDEPQGTAAARVREQLVQIERDIPIWENLRYLPNPALTRAEAKPITAVRRWARQFYPDAVGGSPA